MTLQLDFIRRQFPALAGEWTFMDNAGGSQTLQSVVNRIGEYLLTSDVQHGASYAVSQTATQRVAAGSAAMARYVNAADPSEIVMGGATSLLFRILSLCISQQWQAGDEVIVSHSDHEANVSPWMDLQRLGIKVHIWKTRGDSLRFHLDDLGALMNERTRLVAITHTSNILGTLNPIKEIARFVHQGKALICVDGVAHAPHRLIDVQDLDVDFYAFSFYKVYGPHYALLYGKRDLLIEMPGINHYFITGADTPYKFQPGNVNFEFAYGMLGLTDYLDAVYQQHFAETETDDRLRWAKVYDLFTQHEETLAERLLSFLNQKANVQVIGERSADKNVRVPTISFVVEGRDSKDIVDLVDPHLIGIRYGDFYAKKLIQDLGLEAQNGVVRVSLVHYNTLQEVDNLIYVLDRIL
jgi:cysteine desulfurase family protein (TIGR01976 family)